MKEATLAQASHLLTMIKQKGVPAEQLQDLFESGLLADLLDANVDEVKRDEFRKVLGLTPVEMQMLVPVGYDTLEQMIAAGYYDKVDSDITPERFPLSGESESKRNLVAELIHLNRVVRSKKVVTELDKMGLRPGKIEELLAFGATFPDLQRKFPIVALGSSCLIDTGKNRLEDFVARLDSHHSQRVLDLDRWTDSCWGDGWTTEYRFLAFRK